MRQIILDTETTGLDPKQGHRIIEIGCLEMINRQLTDNHFHCYINPERDIDPGAERVHGISRKFLADKPTFSEIVSDFLDYIKGAELIIHNAPFDVGFLNHEFKLLSSKQKKLEKHCSILDTLELARTLHPGKRNNHILSRGQWIRHPILRESSLRVLMLKVFSELEFRLV